MSRMAAVLVFVAIGSIGASMPTLPEQPRSYEPKQLKLVEILGVRLGMTRKKAISILSRRGLTFTEARENPLPDNAIAGNERYMTNGAQPVVDLTFHRVLGVMVVTGLFLQENVPANDEAEKDRLIQARYGQPTYVKRTPYGAEYRWTEGSGVIAPGIANATQQCLSVFTNCISPNVPINCPAHLIRRAVTMNAGFGKGVSSGSTFYLSIIDTDAQFRAVYRGRRQLPPGRNCPPPIVN